MQTRMAWLLLLVGLTSGCVGHRTPEPVPRLASPHSGRQLWAVAPLRNESGSLQANGVAVADHLARQLERADGIDVAPVNRVLEAMQALGIDAVTDPADARKLRRALGVDALVVGTLSAYDPYDPPKLGLAVELYAEADDPAGPPLDLRKLSRAPVDRLSHPPADAVGRGQPRSVVSGYFDAADPATRQRLRRYAVGRGLDADESTGPVGGWRLYRISMDLYTEFVSHQVSSRLLDAEARRLSRETPQPVS